jgi:hypothetical protein
MRAAQRHDWLNAIVGTLDIAFHLTEDEQYLVANIINQLLDGLNIPDRGAPKALPPSVALEISAGVYSDQLAVARDHGLTRTVRAAQGRDIVVSLETWREALMGMLLTAYPEIAGVQRTLAMKVVGDLLAGIGVPTRAAAAYPDDVIRMYQQLESHNHR